MPTGLLASPNHGLHADKQIPSKAQRRTTLRPVYKRRICRDNRVYVSVPFTIPGVVAAVDYGPMWRVDRDYWVAKITVNAGRHSDATHPNDGTPGGQALIGNMRRVSVDLTDDQPILASDARLKIAANHHQDAVNDTEEGRFEVGDFNIHRLGEGEHIYPRVLQIGTTRPGTGVVFTAVLVPIP